MRQPSITVVVPVLNSARTIRKCLESLLALDYPDYRILVGDGFSTDGTWEILEEFQGEENFKALQLKGFVPVVYNKFLEEEIATEYLALTDADVVVKKDWLKELVKPLKREKVVAVAGSALNPPEPESELQELIGRELESRYKKFPAELKRAPTMNLLVKTEIAKELKFNEDFKIGYDTDFGYRLTSDPERKLAYTEKAVIYHYHRPTWKSFFKQQSTYMQYVPLIYLEHLGEATGDSISTTNMAAQLLVSGLGLGFLFLSLFYRPFLLLSTASLVSLWLLWQKGLDLAETPHEYWVYHKLFFVRNVAWLWGLVKGLPRVVRRVVRKT